MDQRTKLAVITQAKDVIFQQFDEGDITFLEMFNTLEKLQREELDVMLKLKHSSLAIGSSWKIKALMAAIFLGGFFVSPFVYPKIFGFSSAEECVLSSKHKWAASACYDLYPPLKQP